MNAKDEQKERSHGAILDSASRLLREKGISGARVAEVMKGAGLTVGGFYAHFGSKEDMIDAALRLTSKGMRERLFDRLDQKPAGARAEVILKRYLSAAHRDETLRGCPLPAVVGEIGTTAPEHRPVLAEPFVGLLDSPVHWVFSREHIQGVGEGQEGHIITAVVSGARDLVVGLADLVDDLLRRGVLRGAQPVMPDHPLLRRVGDRALLQRVHGGVCLLNRRVHFGEEAVVEGHPADVERDADRPVFFVRHVPGVDVPMARVALHPRPAVDFERGRVLNVLAVEGETLPTSFDPYAVKTITIHDATGDVLATASL